MFVIDYWKQKVVMFAIGFQPISALGRKSITRVNYI